MGKLNTIILVPFVVYLFGYFTMLYELLRFYSVLNAPRLKRTGTGFLIRRSGFNPRALNVILILDKVAVGQNFLPSECFILMCTVGQTSLHGTRF